MLRGKQKKTKANLLLGDYVTINVAGKIERQVRLSEPLDNLVKFESLFDRIVKQRGELHTARQNTDSVIDVVKRRRKILQDSELQELAC